MNIATSPLASLELDRINDRAIGTQQIYPAKVMRDADGYWDHPLLPDFNEDDRRYREWLSTHNLTVQSTCLSDDRNHPAHDRFFEAGENNIADWEPSRPPGDYWFLLWIGPTEDDIVATWAKHTVKVPLLFRSHTDLPIMLEIGMDGGDGFLLWNQCDGFHLMDRVRFDEKGNFVEFVDFMGTRTTDASGFSAWARMPSLASSEMHWLNQFFKRPPGV